MTNPCPMQRQDDLTRGASCKSPKKKPRFSIAVKYKKKKKKRSNAISQKQKGNKNKIYEKSES